MQAGILKNVPNETGKQPSDQSSGRMKTLPSLEIEIGIYIKWDEVRCMPANHRGPSTVTFSFPPQCYYLMFSQPISIMYNGKSITNNNKP